MAKESRPKRLAEYSARAEQAAGELRDALQELYELQQEFQEWRDNLPENMGSSATAEKLDAICEIDIESQISMIDETDAVISEFTEADLPRGFGRD